MIPLPVTLAPFGVALTFVLPAVDDAPEPAGPPRGFPLRIEPFAVDVGHPISLDVAPDGRVFVAETHRYTLGVRQSRGDAELEDAELRVATVDDFKQVLIEQIQAGKFRRAPETDRIDPEYTFYSDLADEIVVYADTDGDGTSDRRQVFAGGFNDWYSGPGADVLTDGERVYYTNIPDLWVLSDDDGNDRVDDAERARLHHGFGVIFSFLAHDMHGLVRGPDGRLYWSIGDRSFHVTTQEGEVLRGKMGAVFRCNPDGSDLELFATGLRNPQDLAFNRFGDLMTGDNNCDKGDIARIHHVVEGSDHGWRLSVQRARSGGPWLRERMWKTPGDLADDLGVSESAVVHNALQPAWILPPLYYPDGQGPSGAFAYPGLGLPARYDDHFFLTHCAGGGGFIQSFAFAPDGAGSRVVDFHVFIEPGPITGPSDAIFGYDGRIYSTNWGSGWELNDDASIVAAWHEESRADPRVEQTRRLFAEGFVDRGIPELVDLLAHVDMRTRQRAQFRLCDLGDEGLRALLAVAVDQGAPEMARMHALWGVTQYHRERHEPATTATREQIAALLDDALARVRELAALAAGELDVDAASARLVSLLGDDGARVRFQAALALARLDVQSARPALVELLEQNDDRDRYLRHAAVLTLARLGRPDALGALAGHPSRAVRLGAVLALRRRADPEVAAFLGDDDFQVLSEAARAVYDCRLESIMPALAATLDAPARPELTTPASEALLRRAILANLWLGDATSCQRMIAAANSPAIPDDKRVLALSMLASWDAPAEKEEVWYDFWPARSRPTGIAQQTWRDAVAGGTAARIRERSLALAEQARQLDQTLLPPRSSDDLLREVSDVEAPEAVRLDALRVLADREVDDARAAVSAGLTTGTPSMRAMARRVLLSLDPDAALAEALAATRAPALVERQQAVTLLRDFCPPIVRYVRVDLPGPERILSMAEVIVLSDGRNVARDGTASQSSVGWDGDPALAIDGDTDGDHRTDQSVTHTRIEQDPWWELDLGASFAVEGLEVFNRTDGGLQGRLNGAVVTLLDEQRTLRWSTVIERAPAESVSFSLGVGGPGREQAESRLSALLEDYLTGHGDAEIELEVIEAAAAIGGPTLTSNLDAYEIAVDGVSPAGFHASLTGGDPTRGEEIFRFHPTAECLRCHKVDGVGGTVGPDLSGVGLRRDPAYLLTSLVDPNADIAEGYGTISVTLKDGRTFHGVDLGVDESGGPQLLVGEERLSFRREEVAAKTTPISTMVAMKDVLTRRELRDVVAWLGTLRTPTATSDRARNAPAITSPTARFTPLELVAVMAGVTLLSLALTAVSFGRRTESQVATRSPTDPR